MRRLGIVLMTAGLISLLVALAFEEVALAALDPRERHLVDLFFYSAAGMCALGGAMFSLRVLIARRSR